MTNLVDRDIELQDMEEDTQKDRYLTYQLGNECYGIEIKYVTEIIGIQAIIHVPELPEYVKGIINLRGKIIPVMDARLRFKKEARDYNDRTCIIVVDLNDLSIGLIVDKVTEVLTIPVMDVVDPPRINRTTGYGYIKKIGKIGNEVILLLDCERLLSEDELQCLNETI